MFKTSKGNEYEVNVFTRKMSRGYTEALLEWSEADAKGNITMNPSNIEKANDVLVVWLFWIKDIDNLSDVEYRELLSEAIDIKEWPSKGSWKSKK